MTRVFLLEHLKAFTEESVRELILPVKPSEEVEEPEPRAAAVYAGHLPEFDSVKRRRESPGPGPPQWCARPSASTAGTRRRAA